MAEHERAVCHVCGHIVCLRADGTMFRHRYGGGSWNDECIGSHERPGVVVPGFVGPYYREPQ